MEAVIDTDVASELLARRVDADLFVTATDVEAVHAGWGTTRQRAPRQVSVEELSSLQLSARSMGPNVSGPRSVRSPGSSRT